MGAVLSTVDDAIGTIMLNHRKVNPLIRRVTVLWTIAPMRLAHCHTAMDTIGLGQ
jgi:hypothetical protein